MSTSTTVYIRETHRIEVPRLRNGRPGYVWVQGWTYTTPAGGEAVADTWANTRHAINQDYPGCKIKQNERSKP